jgi:hypothetical protein
MEHHIATIEAKAKDVHAQMLSLTADESMAKLVKIVHGPGWTTPAESAFLNGILEAMQAHTKALAALQAAALDGASRVALNPQPLPPLPPTEDFNPQPDPPGKQKPTSDFNPQPDPPGKGINPDLNPQPLPPGKTIHPDLNPQPLPPGKQKQ